MNAKGEWLDKANPGVYLIFARQSMALLCIPQFCLRMKHVKVRSMPWIVARPGDAN